MNNLNNINNKLVVLQSILVAFFADIRCINWGLAKGGFVGEGAMSLLYIGFVGLIIVTVLFSQRKFCSSFRTYSVFFPIYLLFYYSLTSAFIAPPVVSISFFLIFTITAFLIPHVTIINPYLMLKAIMILPSFAILRYESVFASVVDWAILLPMDVSYGYLIPIVANIVVLWLYFKEESKIAKIVSILFSCINLIFFVHILLYGSRGPLLCVFLLFCVLWCVNNRFHVGIKLNKYRLTFLTVSGVSAFLFFMPLLRYVLEVLSNYGIELNAISKIIYLQENTGDITNGRASLDVITWRGIAEHPILGNGLDQYDNNNPGESYPHNFLLQILYDGGVFLLLLFMPIFMRIPKYLKKCTKDEFAVFLVLFFGSVPGALFSQDLWCIPVLWMFFGLMCTKQFVISNNN